MSPGVQAVVALVFVTVLGAVLIQPVLDAVDAPVPAPAPTEREESPEAKPEDGGKQTPASSPSPTAASGEVSGAFRTQPLFDRYPGDCLTPDPAAGEAVGFAAETGDGTVAFGSPGGPDAPSSIAAREFLGFNATGAVYAARDRRGRVVIASAGVVASAADRTRFKDIVWSPVSLCGLGLDRGGSLALFPGRRVLVREGVHSAAYSPSGRKLAVVVEEGDTTSIWITHLSGTRMREVHRVPTARGLRVRGWSVDERTLYFTSRGAAGLGFITTTRPPRSGSTGPDVVTQLEHCSERLLGVVDGSIVEISPRGAEEVASDGFTTLSCAPNGAFIAAIQNGSLVLLDGDGNLVRDLTTDTGYREDFVDWGANGAGLLFGRIPDAGGPREVWHIAEGGTPRNTGLVYDGRGAAAIDWSASPPTGLP